MSEALKPCPLAWLVVYKSGTTEVQIIAPSYSPHIENAIPLAEMKPQKRLDDNDAMRIVDSMHTVTTKDRFGLVMIKGEEYQIVDIGLRMLTPRELYRAQGFPDSYQIDTGAEGGHLTKTAQVRMCGNSVCPPLASAIVRENYSRIQKRKAA